MFIPGVVVKFVYRTALTTPSVLILTSIKVEEELLNTLCIILLWTPGNSKLFCISTRHYNKIYIRIDKWLLFMFKL